MAKIWLEMVVKQPFMSRKFDAPPSTNSSSSRLEQLDFKLEKNIGIYKHAGKVRKYFF